jgi:AcrR family transcriptional regulator
MRNGKLASVPPALEAGAAAESTRERLFATASELFRTKGFAATTTREIAAALGIQKATLYHHIRRKDDLLYEMCRESLRRMHETAGEVFGADEEPLDRLRHLIRSHMISALHDRDQHATMLTELRFLPETEREEILELRQEYELRLEQAIAAAQEAGAIRADVSAKDLRLALLNMLNWTIFWFRPDGEHTPEELGRLYANIFVEGSAPRP